nr:unnamed protein product [Meloidogyne enterolobii]
MDQNKKDLKQHKINLELLQVQEEEINNEQQRLEEEHQQQLIDFNTKREQLGQQKQKIAMQKLEEEGIIRELESQEKEKESGGTSSSHNMVDPSVEPTDTSVHNQDDSLFQSTSTVLFSSYQQPLSGFSNMGQINQVAYSNPPIVPNLIQHKSFAGGKMRPTKPVKQHQHPGNPQQITCPHRGCGSVFKKEADLNRHLAWHKK